MNIDNILAFVAIAVLLITVGIQTIKLRHSKGTIRKWTAPLYVDR